MISHLISASSFGIIPILYKSLLSFDIDSITILIITKLIIFVFCLFLLTYGDNYKTFMKDIKEITKNNNKCFYVSLLFILSAFVYFYGQYNYILLFKNSTETNISTIIIACYPIITIILSYFYFNETISVYQFLGIILIFTGLALITSKIK
tara:strand:- start:15261 stop:15713 length:453 start_codon:yes stop_codon:yes gene_type:complete